MDRKTLFSGIKKVAVKIGSSVLTDEHGDIKEDMFVGLARGISNIKSKDIDTVLISSGAIAAGMGCSQVTRGKAV